MPISDTEKRALIHTAMRRVMSEDWDKALQDYQNLAERFPKDPFVLEPLAKVQQKLGMNEACAETLLKAAQGYRDMGLFRKAAQVKAHILDLPFKVPA